MGCAHISDCAPRQQSRESAAGGLEPGSPRGVHESNSTSPVDTTLESSSPEVRELVSRAHAHHDNGEPGLAIETLLEALELEPDNRRVRTILAITLAMQGYINSSEQQFIEALGVAEAHYNLGVILFEMGEIAEAEQRFLLAVQNQPSLKDAHIWLDTTRAELAMQTAQLYAAINPRPVRSLPAENRPNTIASSASDNSEMILTSAGIDGVQTNTTAGRLPEITPANVQADSVCELPQQSESVAEVVKPATISHESHNDSVPVDTRPDEFRLSAPATIAPLTDAERTELRRLQSENEQLRMERDILQKAIGVIAGDNL